MNSTLDSISRNTARIKCGVIGSRKKNKGTGLTRTTKTLHKKRQIKNRKKMTQKLFYNERKRNMVIIGKRKHPYYDTINIPLA